MGKSFNFPNGIVGVFVELGAGEGRYIIALARKEPHGKAAASLGFWILGIGNLDVGRRDLRYH